MTEGVNALIEMIAEQKGAVLDTKGTGDNGGLIEKRSPCSNDRDSSSHESLRWSKYIPATGKIQATDAAWTLEFDGPKFNRS